MRKNGLLLLALLVLPLCGCLERVETITVRPDGSLHVRHEFDAAGGDLDSGAAGAPAGDPWKTGRRTYEADNGEVHHVLEAEAEFASAADVPGHLGERSERGLRFTTRLDVREEDGRKVYAFERRYAPRAWAANEAYIDEAFPEKLREVVRTGDGLEDLTKKERRRLVEGLILHEKLQKRDWAMRAAGDGVGDRLAARAAVDAYYDRALSVEDVEAVLDGDRDSDDVADEVYAGLRDAVAARVRARRGAEAAKRVRARLDLERRGFQVTTDLGDETFEVRLALPGEVKAHNADGVEDGRLVWKFHGKDFRDREQVLLAVSESAPEAGAEGGK